MTGCRSNETSTDFDIFIDTSNFLLLRVEAKRFEDYKFNFTSKKSLIVFEQVIQTRLSLWHAWNNKK
jgi:hypothetical protein